MVTYDAQVMDEMDPVFKALADPHRRHLLDRLHERDGQTLSELQSYLRRTAADGTKDPGQTLRGGVTLSQ